MSAKLVTTNTNSMAGKDAISKLHRQELAPCRAKGDGTAMAVCDARVGYNLTGITRRRTRRPGLDLR
uniref:Uncharacterized protein n=1 Tax=Panagrellus redivivus TaxID=6233 RepID=A0A7E4V0G2_PANRE